MQHTKLVTTHANGNRVKYHVSPPIRHPVKLHLTGYMTNGGVAGTPLIIRVSGVQATSEAYVLSSASASTQVGNAVIVVGEPASCKWQHPPEHAIGHFNSGELHSFEVEITDTSTGLPAAYSPPASVNHIVVLEFTISHRDKRFATSELTTYKSDMYSALN